LLTAALILAPLQLHLVLVKRAGEMVALPLLLAAAAARGVTQGQAVTRKIIHLVLPGLAAAAAQGVGTQGVGLVLAAAAAA
jgi:hypothetical protein